MTSHTRAYDRYAPLLAEFAALDRDDARRPQLLDRLVRAYRPLARNIAARYSRRGESADDLEQVALIGLIGALDRYDPQRRTDFLSFAIPTMTGEVRRHFRDALWAVRTPRGIKDRYLQVGAAADTWSQRTGRSPTMPELAEHLGMPVEEVHEAYTAGSAYRPTSLDRTLDDADDVTLMSVLGSMDPALERVDDRAVVHDLVGALPARERRLLALRFVHERTQREIAAELCISQMHVSRLLTQTLAMLRDQLTADLPAPVTAAAAAG